MLEDIKILRSKVVKIRKPRECWKCQKINPKKVKMVCDTITIDGQIENAYHCVSCVKTLAE